MKSIIQVDKVVLPAGFVFDEIRKLNSGSGCSIKFNQSSNDICRICCD